MTPKAMGRLLRIKLVCISVLLFGCSNNPEKKPFSLFGNVYQIDSVAGQEGFADPFYIVLTKDSLFNAFGYWDYSFPYKTQLRINDSLSVLNEKSELFSIEGVGEGFWLQLPKGQRQHYSIAPGKYDSAYKHLRLMETQESLLLGKWRLDHAKTEAKSILGCPIEESSVLRFTRSIGHKIVQFENIHFDKIDTCLRRDFRLDGNAVLIFEYDGFPPFKILKLDVDNLVLQDFKNILYFEKDRGTMAKVR